MTCRIHVKHSHLWHDSSHTYGVFTCVTWCIHTHVMHSHVWHDAFTRTCICMRDMTYSNATWCIHSHVWHDSFTRVTWCVDVCHMTYSDITHPHLTCHILKINHTSISDLCTLPPRYHSPCVCVRACALARVCTRVRASASACACVCTCARAYARARVFVCHYLFVCVYVYVYMSECVLVSL